MPPPHTLNLFGVLSESKTIINAHSRHFLALSVLSLLPLSFSLITFPTLHLSLSQSHVISTHFLVLNPTHFPTTPPLLYSLFLCTLSLSSIATITYSTLHAFYGTPVNLFPAISSLTSSFFPLASTTLAAQLIIFIISLNHFLFFVLIIRIVENLGFVIDYTSYYFMLFCSLFGVVLCLVNIYLLVNWSLACVVVVTETKWGLEPLWRSAYLVKGMESVSVSLNVLFGVLVGFWVWMNANDVLRVDAVDGWGSWPLVVQLVTGTSVLTLFLLYNVSANAVLYMYCKALHGELAIEIVEDFAREYVSLPFDDCSACFNDV